MKFSVDEHKLLIASYISCPAHSSSSAVKDLDRSVGLSFGKKINLQFCLRQSLFIIFIITTVIELGVLVTDLYYILLFFIFFIIVGIRLRHLAVLNVKIRPIIRVAFACPITWKYDVIDKTEST